MMKWYFVTIIVLTYCEKKLFQCKENKISKTLQILGLTASTLQTFFSIFFLKLETFFSQYIRTIMVTKYHFIKQLLRCFFFNKFQSGKTIACVCSTDGCNQEIELDVENQTHTQTKNQTQNQIRATIRPKIRPIIKPRIQTQIQTQIQIKNNAESNGGVFLLFLY